MNFVKIIFNKNLNNFFIYKKNPVISNISLQFKRVLVPFKKKLIIGFVIEDYSSKDQFEFEVEEVIDILDDIPLFTEFEYKFYKWMSEYYIVPPGQIIFNALPPFSVNHFKVLLNNESVDNINENEKKIIELLKKGEKLSKIQKNFKNFFITLNSLKNKNIIKIKKSSIKTKKIKFLKLTNYKNETLINIFKNNDILPYIFVKNQLKNINKYIKNEDLQVIEKNKEFIPENIDASFNYFRPEKLNKYQEHAFNVIKDNINKNIFAVHLLFGVTGSGKTEVYLKSIEVALAKNKQVLYLVPEISLTSNIGYIILTAFPYSNIIIYHSKITKNARYEIWNKCLKNEVNIVIGARSALFTPLKNLGLIIVDEEHEQSYKQEDKPRYNARDCAVMKGKILNSTVILGSATPSLQSYYNAKKGKYNLHYLKKRVNNQPLPDFEIIDLKNSFGDKIISKQLKNEINTTIKQGGQAILLLNKKGYASYLLCKNCGFVFKCKNCDLTLTYYKSKNSLICSYCDNVYNLPQNCPSCNRTNFKFMGKGTEKIVEKVIEELKDVKVARFDAESTSKKGENVRILKEFNNGNIDILVGTQMLAKGYDFQNVSLVGIVTVDNILNFPDFNSTEKTFQLIIQCAGRAGRKNKRGKVILQTFNPDNYLFKFCKDYRFEDFYNYELLQRKKALYPPFYSIVHLIFESNNLERAKTTAVESAQILIKISNDLINILGPVESQIKKIRNKYRFSILLKSKYKKSLNKACIELLNILKNKRGVDIKIDIDPINLN